MMKESKITIPWNDGNGSIEIRHVNFDENFEEIEIFSTTTSEVNREQELVFKTIGTNSVKTKLKVIQLANKDLSLDNTDIAGGENT